MDINLLLALYAVFMVLSGVFVTIFVLHSLLSGSYRQYRKLQEEVAEFEDFVVKRRNANLGGKHDNS